MSKSVCKKKFKLVKTNRERDRLAIELVSLKALMEVWGKGIQDSKGKNLNKEDRAATERFVDVVERMMINSIKKLT